MWVRSAEGRIFCQHINEIGECRERHSLTNLFATNNQYEIAARRDRRRELPDE